MNDRAERCPLPEYEELEYLRIIRNNSDSPGAPSMTHISASLRSGSVAATAIIVEAIRRWRVARDGEIAVQPYLFAALADRGCGILAPVFDSLLSLFEAALRRPLRTGEGEALSHDETALIDLLSGVGCDNSEIGTDSGIGIVFGGAVDSARIMLRKAFALPLAI